MEGGRTDILAAHGLRASASTWLTRHIEFDPSSVINSEPSGAAVTPTGRPHTSPLGNTNPVTKS